jgi:hypothetical protein
MGIREDSVRGLETNPDTKEWRVVSFRLRVPAQQE